MQFKVGISRVEEVVKFQRVVVEEEGGDQLQHVFNEVIVCLGLQLVVREDEGGYHFRVA